MANTDDERVNCFQTIHLNTMKLTKYCRYVKSQYIELA